MKGEKKPPGRPVLPPEQAQTAMIRERVTEAQKAEYEQRGEAINKVQGLLGHNAVVSGAVGIQSTES